MAAQSTCSTLRCPDSDSSEFSEIGADVVFMGHTHHPFVRQVNRKLFVNVGSCGLPRGQDPRASVCNFDVAERRAQIIRFDVSKYCRRVLSQFSLSLPVMFLLSRCAQYTRSSGFKEGTGKSTFMGVGGGGHGERFWKCSVSAN